MFSLTDARAQAEGYNTSAQQRKDTKNVDRSLLQIMPGFRWVLPPAAPTACAARALLQSEGPDRPGMFELAR